MMQLFWLIFLFTIQSYAHISPNIICPYYGNSFGLWLPDEAVLDISNQSQKNVTHYFGDIKTENGKILCTTHLDHNLKPTDSVKLISFQFVSSVYKVNGQTCEAKSNGEIKVLEMKSFKIQPGRIYQINSKASFSDDAEQMLVNYFLSEKDLSDLPSSDWGIQDWANDKCYNILNGSKLFFQ